LTPKDLTSRLGFAGRSGNIFYIEEIPCQK